jgi:FtsZ-binding cell division protein ZapB
MTERIYSSRNTFGGNVPPSKTCPQCERYKEASFRDAIEFDKFRTMLKIADDMLTALRAEVERLKAHIHVQDKDAAEEGAYLRGEIEKLKAACEGHLQNAANIRGNLSAENERLRSENGLLMAENRTAHRKGE